MKHGLLVSVMALSVAFTAHTVSAETYVVDQAKGDDAAAGSDATPFKTVTMGISALKQGDTLVINGGTYREMVTVKTLGTAAAPITIKAAPSQRVILSGADRVAEWKPCTKEQAGGNENFAHIITADVDWVPTALFENFQEQTLARTPNEGWWPTVKADANTVTDPVHLNQKTDVWSGSTVFFFRLKGVVQTRQPVKSFDPATGTLTLAGPLSTSPRVIYTPGSDRYRLENKVTLIDQPGEWCFERRGENGARLYYWPRAEKLADAVIELPRRPRILNLGATAHCTVEGLELVHTINPGRTADAAIANDVEKDIPGAGDGITIKGCTIHHNGRFAFFGRGYKNLKLLGNLVYRNEYGLSIAGNTGALIEGNEVAENLVDGVIISASSDITVRRNFVHHHCLFGHPDNMQVHSDSRNLTYEDNFVLASGQSFMLEACDNVTWRNNLVVGAAANMVIMGHGNATHGTWERNTFALWTSSLFSFTAQDYALKDNIMSNNGGALFYSIPAKGSFSSDRNLWFVAPGVGGRFARMASQGGGGFQSLDALRAASGQEKTSELKDPQFKNAPLYCVTLDNKRIGECTREKLILSDADARLFQAGDFVEIHFDGVVRKVKTVDGSTLTLDPPLPATPDRNLFVANWKKTTNFTLDFASPFADKYGSTVNAPAYLRGDFNNDGRRDIPEYR